MKRRIALAILLTSWLVLLAGGAAAFFAIRAALLDELDASLVLRASSLPEVLGITLPGGAEPSLPAGDRYVIRNAAGQTLARPAAQAQPGPPATVLSRSFATLADGSRLRTVTISFPVPGGARAQDRLTVIYSGSAARYDLLVGRIWIIFAAVGLASGIIVAAVAVAVAGAALRPLRGAAETVASINDATLDRRIDVSSLPPELVPMAGHLNEMLARLEHGLQQRKQFLADAAHELRTPVTALLTTAEIALRRSREPAQLTAALQDCLSDARLLRKLVETLLEQFRLEARGAAAPLEELDLSAVLDLSVSAAESAARHKGVALRRLYAPPLRFATRPDLFRSVVSNLVANAIDYNVPGGTVDIVCQADAHGLSLSVADTGKGIAPEAVPHVFEPFYRAAGDSKDPHAEDGGHVGLGLYLVKSHVDALGGRCTVESTPGQGTRFQIHLPAPEDGHKLARPPATPAAPQPHPTKTLTWLSSFLHKLRFRT